MKEMENVIDNLNTAKLILCHSQMLTPEMCIRIGQAVTSALALLKEQPDIVRCKDCVNYNIRHEFKNDKDALGRCDNISYLVGPYWYCADGKRRCEDS
jgi:tRNA G26 N,N-dimethylase Trm1